MKTSNTLIPCLIFLLAAPGSTAPHHPHHVYLQHVQRDVDDITQQLHELEAKSSTIAAERREHFAEAVKALWKKERLARVQLEELKHAPEERWKKLRATEDSTLIHLRKSYHYVVNHFLK